MKLMENVKSFSRLATLSAYYQGGHSHPPRIRRRCPIFKTEVPKSALVLRYCSWCKTKREIEINTTYIIHNNIIMCGYFYFRQDFN